MDGRHLCDYLHRIPITNIKTIFVGGNVRISTIEYQSIDVLFYSFNFKFVILFLIFPFILSKLSFHPRYDVLILKDLLLF